MCFQIIVLKLSFRYMTGFSVTRNVDDVRCYTTVKDLCKKFMLAAVLRMAFPFLQLYSWHRAYLSVPTCNRQ